MLQPVLQDRTGTGAISEGEDGQGVIAGATDACPGASILDLTTPGIGGRDLFPLLRQLCDDAGIVVYANGISSGQSRDLVAAGADSVCDKTQPVGEFWSRDAVGGEPPPTSFSLTLGCSTSPPEFKPDALLTISCHLYAPVVRQGIDESDTAASMCEVIMGLKDRQCVTGIPHFHPNGVGLHSH